ncbi:peptide ABC transporter substrate-binding protein [Roseisolibacter sp. H3M3-2]|uniref:peptide ABC transporter substrate-binding protein n=1 Tax=Roseisolibacter sp. H3M3-2 TaxID=3031323 RepID=UPI0023DCAA48|nr:peptide ABC transporter substrate-binding protein [Roseisolibacter sp. H3M3-2]MDF1503708.1 peptide ABC transporter substrate-binding protein [Roseisolibacter sp. H3M3-2]
MRPRHVLPCAALALAACGGERAAPSAGAPQALVIATPSDADALLPPLVATTQGKQVVDMMFDYLAALGDSMVVDGDRGFAPQLARGWRWAPDSLSIAFELDPRARWHDGRPVRAADVAFSFALYTDPKVGSPHAANFAGIDSVTVRDSLTAVAWWTRRGPEQFYQLAYNLVVMPEHLLGGVPRDGLLTSAFASKPVGSGRFRLRDWKRRDRIELVADSGNYRGRPAVDRLIWTIAPDPGAAALRVLAGEADVLETVRGDVVQKVAQSSNVRPAPYGSLDYGYLAFNLRDARAKTRPHALFADRAVRLALSRAVDRDAVVRNALDSLGRVALGPLTRAQSTADESLSAPGFDVAAARAALDSAGWRLAAGDSVRARGGRPLEFRLLVPSSSSTRMRLAVILQEQFRGVGVHVELDPVDGPTFVERMRTGKFDAALNVWRTDPSPAGLRQAWGSPVGDDVGANFGRYANAAFDATVDSAATELSPERRRALFRRAYAQVLADAPAIWLYEPRNLAAVSRRFEPVGMRADAWWAHLADWKPAGPLRTAGR